MKKTITRKPLVIAVTSFSGNVGKTLICDNILLPRMPEATRINIESINAGADSGIKLRGEQFGKIQDMILDGGDLVLDVGASNIEALMDAMAEYDGSHEDIDRFVVPVTPETKQQIDSINTVRALVDLGVDASRIRMVFNRVPKRQTVEDAFPAIFGFHAKTGAFTLHPAAAIAESEAFDLLKALNRSLIDMATDTRDYRADLASADDHAAERIKTTIRAQRLARPLAPQLDQVFNFIAG